MKKTLALFLAIMILTNFHCTRLQIRTSDSGNILASCKALLFGSDKVSEMETHGVLVLMEDHIQFRTKEKTTNIPYENVHSVYLGSGKGMIFPHMAGPHFTKQNENSPPYFFVIFMMALFFGVAILAYILLAGGKIFAPNVEMTIDMPGEGGPAAFKIKKAEFKKIYSILNEKSDVSLDILEKVPVTIF